MPDRRDDEHLAPAPEPEIEPTSGAPGLGSLRAFVGSMGRFVRLCERQGTRMVDVFDRWADAAEEHNRIARDQARALHRLAGALGAPDEEESDDV